MAKSSSKGTSAAEGYGQFAASMSAAGQRGLDGRGSTSASGKGSAGAGRSGSGSVSVSSGTTATGSGRGTAGAGQSGRGTVSVSPGSSPSISGSGQAGVGLSAAARGGVTPTGITVAPGSAPATRAQEYGRAANSMTRAGLMDLSGNKTFNPVTGTYSGKASSATTPDKSAHYASLPPQDQFLSSVYSAGRRAGLTDVEARLAASQAALETRFGKSVVGNNYFGIKAGRSWNGPTVKAGTWEEVGGKRVNTTDAFRAYDDPEQSLKDWQGLIGRNWSGVKEAETFDEAAAALNAGKRGGYATDSRYASKLASINARGERSGAFTTELASLPGEMSVPAARPDPSPVAMADARVGARPDATSRFEQTYLAAAPETTDMTEEEYFGAPAAIPTAPAATQGTQEAEAFPPAPPQPEAPSRGRQIAGTIIDGAVGAIPGVGLFAAGANALARATGNKTIGDRVTGLFADGEFGKYPLPDFAPEGEAGDWLHKSYAEMKPEDREKRFEAIYFSGFQDDTPRPTPAQKWGRRSTYGAREYA